MTREIKLLTWPTKLAESRIRVATFVPGDPISKQRPKFCVHKSGKVYTPKHTKEAEQAIAWSIKVAHRQIVEDGDSLFGVRLAFYCKNFQRRDLDNMCKLVFDACNKFIWRDDTQVAELHSAVFRDCREPGTDILIYIIPNATAHRLFPCALCGKEFTRYPSSEGIKYCSRECSGTARRTGQFKDCDNCGKQIYRGGERYSKHVFCSRECKSIFGTVELACKYCEKPFKRHRSVNRGANQKKFCSEECHAKYWEGRPRRKQAYVCPSCGEKTMSKKEYKCCISCRIRTGVFRSPGGVPVIPA